MTSARCCNSLCRSRSRVARLTLRSLRSSSSGLLMKTACSTLNQIRSQGTYEAKAPDSWLAMTTGMQSAATAEYRRELTCRRCEEEV